MPLLVLIALIVSWFVAPLVFWLLLAFLLVSFALGLATVFFEEIMARITKNPWYTAPWFR